MTPTPLQADAHALQTLQHCHEALVRIERSGHPALMAQAALSMACCYRELRAAEAAERMLEQALTWAGAAQSQDAVVEVLCELCGVLVERACALDLAAPGSGHRARRRARELAFEATRRTAHVADAAWEVQVLLHLSTVLERLGDHGEAVTLQARADGLARGTAVRPDPSVLPGLGRLADA